MPRRQTPTAHTEYRVELHGENRTVGPYRRAEDAVVWRDLVAYQDWREVATTTPRGRSAYGTPERACPYCGTPCEADFVDVGVGMQQVGPYGCGLCHAVEVGPCDGDPLTPTERRVGWYEPAPEAEAELPPSARAHIAQLRSPLRAVFDLGYSTWADFLRYRVCAECQAPCHESYMVRDEVWAAVGMPQEGVLHVACLERRLGRALTPEDLTAAPVNEMARRLVQTASTRA